MKKIIVGVLVLIVIAIVAISFYFVSNLDDLIKTAIEKHGSEATNTLVQVDRVKMSLKEGSGAIFGIGVGNPAGFTHPNVFSLGEMSTKVDFQSVNKGIVIIDDIQVLSPQVFFEVNQKGDINLNELKKNIISTQPAAPTTDETSEQVNTKPIKMIIRNLKFADGEINAIIGPLNKTYELSLPAIMLKDLGAPNGATPDELAEQVLTTLTDQAKKAVKKEGFYREFEAFKAETKQKLDAEKAKLKNEANAKLESEKGRAKEKLKGLFDKIKL